MGTYGRNVLVVTLGALDRFYAGHNNPTALLPPLQSTANTELVMFPSFLPIPIGLVSMFCDGCHPYTGLRRLTAVTRLMDASSRRGFEIVRYWLQTACHAQANGTSILSYQWENPMLSIGGSVGMQSLQIWAENRYRLILPPSNPPPLTTGLDLNDVELMMETKLKERELEREKSAPPKGSRKMRKHEIELFLAVAGLPLDTPEEEYPAFIKFWESTPGNEAAMRLALAGLIGESAKALHMPNPVNYLRYCFIKSVLSLQFGIGLDDSYHRSHQGMSLASIHYMMGTFEEAAEAEYRDQNFEGASHTTPDDHEKKMGKPGAPPKSLQELIESIDVYLLHHHAFVGLKGDHANLVVQIRNVLREKYKPKGLSLTQDQIDDVFWAITVDGRHTWQSVDNASRSTLRGTLEQLLGKTVVPRIDTPRDHFARARGGKRSATTAFVDTLTHAASQRGGGARSVSPVPALKNARVSWDSSVGGGNDAAALTSPPKTQGYGPVNHYHPKLRLKWATICEKLNHEPLLVNLLKQVKQPDGNNYGLKSLTGLLGGQNNCSVGHVTGKCNKAGCPFVHNLKVTDDAALATCKVLDEGAKGLVKKEPQK